MHFTLVWGGVRPYEGFLFKHPSSSFLPPEIMNVKCFILPVAASLAMSSFVGAAIISLDFESQTAGSGSTPSGWSYLHTGLGPNGTYVTSAANGGSTGTGLGAVLAASHGAHDTNKLPYSYLVNSGSATGFDVTKSITGSYDFNMANSAQYDTAGFLFGDIKSGTMTNSPGQLIMILLANGGFGQANAESRFVDGASNQTYAPTSNAGFADNTWYRNAFTWTPTSGTTGNLSYTATRWNGSSWVAHSTFSITGHTFDSAEAYFGIADIAAGSTTFDNIVINGELIPEPSVMGLFGLAGLLALRRRR